MYIRTLIFILPILCLTHNLAMAQEKPLTTYLSPDKTPPRQESEYNGIDDCASLKEQSLKTISELLLIIKDELISLSHKKLTNEDKLAELEERLNMLEKKENN